MSKYPLTIISGPTATGKTAMSLEMARATGASIVNFDSLLFYKELEIGTARPSKKELAQAPHYFVGTHSIQHPLNASEFSKEATPLIDQLLEKTPVVLVGGSGFYLKALLYGMYESPTSSQDVLQRSQRLYDEEGIAPFLKILQEHDPVSFERLHENDHYRVRRATEHFWSHGRAFSAAEKDFDPSDQARPIFRWAPKHFYLDIPKDRHFEIIQKRTKTMFESGLIEEVRKLLAQGFSPALKPLQSIGYKEVVAHLNGELKTQKECEDLISIHTRQLAKAQRTFFASFPSKTLLNPLIPS